MRSGLVSLVGLARPERDCLEIALNDCYGCVFLRRLDVVDDAISGFIVVSKEGSIAAQDMALRTHRVPADQVDRAQPLECRRRS